VAAGLDENARERLGKLREGIDRSRKLLEQLLSLAGTQGIGEAPLSSASLRQLCRSVPADLMPLAFEKGIDIGTTGEEDVQVTGNALDLSSAVKNVLDNAIRYTPPGGQVDLSVTREGRTGALTIEDNGPGIPPAERTRV
jgi:two-component system OmpR family sensor kinase